MLGKIQLTHDSPVERLGVFRMLMGTFFLALAFYFLTGLFGGSLGEFDAWLPPSSPNDFALNRSGGSAEAKWHETFDAALQKAKAENRPAFLNFTGVTCTNCRWMEKNMFPDPAVKKELEKFVLAELYTDREDTAEHQKIDEENGKLQAEKFGTVALPLYAVIDTNGNILAKFPGLTRNKKEFVEFLQRGASRFQPLTAQK